jgi:GWxTD domain-containing protein
LYESYASRGEKLASLQLDIMDIIEEQEREQLKKLHTAEEKIRFLKLFWISSDPTPATVVNERLIEHYTRLSQARDQYSWPNKRGYDDRGRVYVQYGPPDNWINDESTSGALPLISWVYFRYGRSVSFDFIDRGFGYEMTNQLTAAIVSTGIISYVSTAEQLVARRASASPEYMRLNNDLNPIFEILRTRPEVLLGAPNFYRARVERFCDYYAVEAIKKQSSLPAAVSEVSLGREELPCALSLAQFCDAENKPELVAIYGFKTAEVKSNNGAPQVRVIATIRDTVLNICTSQDTVLTFSPITPQEFVAAKTYHLPRSKYFYLLEIDNPAGRQHGQRDFSFTLGNYSKAELALSSVILAKNVLTLNDTIPGEAVLRRHNLAIIPSPFTTLQRQTPR